MKKTLILFFFCNILFAQTTIKGVVKDSLGNAISFANVQLVKHATNEVINYKSTTENGAFEFVVNGDAINLDLKVTHISYYSKVISVTFNSQRMAYETIILKSKDIQLQNIKLTGKFKDAVDKNDTIKYNLTRLLNGSEEKLKDVIAKLPGLKIDENGKIKFNGKTIDNFLIEGDELYNNQHQLATENIKAQMIDKIEVLKDFKSFSSLGDGNGGEKKTALNVYIKDEFKNKINGAIDAEGGYKKRYKLHNYTFNFNKKIKASLIADVNNTNNIIFSVNDYFDLKKISNQEITSLDNNNSLTVDDNIPDFLFAEDDVKSKTIKNLTFNINSSLSKKTKIQGYSITNLINQEQFINTQQLFYASNDQILNKTSNIIGSSLFNSNYIKIENKPNDKNYCNYTLSTNYSKDVQNSFLNTSFLNVNTAFKEKKSVEDFTIGQNFSYKKIINNNSKFDFIVYNEFSNSNRVLNLNSDQPFLNLNFGDDFLITQNTNQKRIKLGSKIKYSLKLNKNSFNFQIGSSVLNETFNNNIEEKNLAYDFKLASSFYNNYIGFNYSRIITEKIRFSLGSDVNYNVAELTNFSNSNNATFLPFASVNYIFSKKSNLGFSFKRSLSSYTLNQFIKGNVINDYRTVLNNNSLFNNTFLLSNQFSLNYSYSNFDKNLNAFFNLMYNKKDNNIGVNTIIDNNNTYSQNKLISLDNTAYMLFLVDKKFKNIPFGINFQAISSLLKKENFTNYVSNQIESYQTKYDLSINSYLKNNDFNIGFGLSISNSNSISTLTGISNKFQKTIPYLNFNGLVLKDKLSWELKNYYYKYSTTNFSIKNILDIRPKITYKTKNLNYYVSGGNILNIKEDNSKAKSSNADSFVEQSYFNSLSGYVNVGISVSF